MQRKWKEAFLSDRKAYMSPTVAMKAFNNMPFGNQCTALYGYANAKKRGMGEAKHKAKVHGIEGKKIHIRGYVTELILT